MKKVTELIPIRAHGQNFSIQLYEMKYHNGTPAIQAFCFDEGYPEPFGMITVNIEGVSEVLPEGEFCVKTWSENEFWAVDALKASGLYEPTGRETRAGFCMAPIWRRKK